MDRPSRGGNAFYAIENGLGNLAESQWLKFNEDGEDVWYYFKPISKNGDVLEGGAVKADNEKVYKWKEIQGKYYCFDSDGKMMHDQLLDVDEKIQYAQKDGSLAMGWYSLNVPDSAGAVEVCTHVDDCDCSWYYFKMPHEENGKLKGGAVVADEGKILEETVGESQTTYAFDDEGRMISRGWNLETKHYYMSDGAKATNKWLPIDGVWYQFNASGDVVKYALINDDKTPVAGSDKVASSSDAVPAEVSSITPVNKSVSVPIGESVDISFKVELVSNSDTKAALTKDHDFWLKSSERMGSFKNKTIQDDNIYNVVYEAGIKAGSEDVYLWIDGKRSLEPVTVVTTLTQSGEDDEMKKDEVKDVVDSILNSTADSESAVESLKELNASENDDAIRAEVQNQLLNEAATSGNNAFKTLEDNYVADKKITVEEPSVSSDVIEQHGDIDVKVTGAGLNAGEGDSVQLQVSLPEEEPEVEGTYRSTVAFELKLFINQENKENLEIPIVISMKAPDGFTSRDKLINLHDGQEINVKFTIKGGKVYFVTDRFSTYVFAITDKPATTTTSSSSGGRNDVNSELNADLTSNSRAGNWIKDANGWWIRLNDGTYPINIWKYLDFNGAYQWYHFDSIGYMNTGWFTDTDGRRYYLNPVSDGTQGAMAMGWKFIDGYWYYFNPIADGTQGALLVNTTTPDGYTVNANGQWIQ